MQLAAVHPHHLSDNKLAVLLKAPPIVELSAQASESCEETSMSQDMLMSSFLHVQKAFGNQMSMVKASHFWC